MRKRGYAEFDGSGQANLLNQFKIPAKPPSSR